MAMYVGRNSTQASGNSVQFYGTVNVHTFGWTFHLRTHGPSIVAIILVTLLTVAAGAFAMMPIDRYEGASTHRKLRVASAPAFNPTAAMDVLLASSAGDLARALSEPGKHNHHGREQGLRIVLGTTGKGKPALRTVWVGDAETRAGADVERCDSLASRDDHRLWEKDAGDWSRSRSDVAHCDGSREYWGLQQERAHASFLGSGDLDDVDLACPPRRYDSPWDARILGRSRTRWSETGSAFSGREEVWPLPNQDIILIDPLANFDLDLGRIVDDVMGPSFSAAQGHFSNRSVSSVYRGEGLSVHSRTAYCGGPQGRCSVALVPMRSGPLAQAGTKPGSELVAHSTGDAS